LPRPRVAGLTLQKLYEGANKCVAEKGWGEAIPLFREMARLDPDSGATFHNLGVACLMVGLSAEAVASFERAANLRSEKSLPFLVDALELEGRGPAEWTNLGGTQRCIIQFGLGKAFDDLGEYAEAMRYYEMANKFRAASVRLDRAEMVRFYDEIIARFSAEELERAAESAARPAMAGEDMPVFIVGMPRSGTTLVEQILSSHSAVGAGGELRFWRFWFLGSGGVAAIPATSALSKAADDYLAALRRIGPDARRVTDKETSNFELLWLLRLALPSSRIIHCRRSPIDTCLSIFFTNFAGRHSYPWDRGDLVFAYGQYERLVEHWRRVLPADHFTEVQYETLVAEGEAETRRLVAFCGLEWDDACLAHQKNNRPVATAGVWQARQGVYTTSVERWRRYEPWLGELRQLLAAAAA
jgi:tetratricopeptide (TPR) repeat protein